MPQPESGRRRLCPLPSIPPAEGKISRPPGREGWLPAGHGSGEKLPDTGAGTEKRRLDESYRRLHETPEEDCDSQRRRKTRAVGAATTLAVLWRRAGRSWESSRGES